MINITKKLFMISFVLVFLMAVYGCHATTNITSTPNGAKVYLNDEYKCTTPCNFQVNDIVGPGSIYRIRAELPGYKSLEKAYQEQVLDAADKTIPRNILFNLVASQKPMMANRPSEADPASDEHQQTSASQSSHSLLPLKSSSNWAVIVGLSKYKYSGQSGLTNLIFADEDAKAFARVLRNLGWSESHIKLLMNEEATERNIRIALESWLTKAGPNDQIVLFWAGHGFADPEDPEKVYFACYDTDISIPATGYRMDKVRMALEEKKARNVVLLADTCHAGKLITRGDDELPMARKISRIRAEQKTPKGWIFMVAADTDRKAIEHSSWTNGAFTHSLIKGLSGKADGFQSAGARDGIVTMGELKDYLNSAMPDETQKVLGVAKRPVITTSSGDPGIWKLSLKPK